MVTALEAGSEDLQECRACLQGQYILRPNEDSCQTCPPGLTCRGDDVVVAKVAGSTWVRNGSIYLLTACPTGYWLVSTGVSGSFDAAVQECQPCPEGTECTLQSCVACSACLAGQYKDSKNAAPCQPCKADTYSSVVGAKTANDCLSCPA